MASEGLLVAALLFWTAVLRPRSGYWASLAALLATLKLTGVVCIALLLQPAALYTAYGDAAAAWGLSPSEDEQLGWSRKRIQIADDGQSMIVPHGTYVDFDEGALKLDGVQVLSSASELNELNTNTDIVAVVHHQVTPDALSATAVMAAQNLAAEAQQKTTGLTNPDVVRTVTVKGNVSGISGDVVITGTNVNNETIDDTIALNGATEVEGVKAFKTVTQVDLPAESHTPAAQVETATVVGAIIDAGNAEVIVTAAGMTGSPKTKSVAVEALDDASAVAGKIRTALDADEDVTALFAVSGTGADVVLTRLAPAADDASLNISIDNGTCTGLTPAATSADTTAGVPYDTVSVGIAKKFGLPHIVANAGLLQAKLFDGSDDNGSLAVDADEVEKNLYSLDGTPDGEKVLDLYYLA